MNKLDRRDALKGIVTSGSAMTVTKWVSPAILLQALPSHAQASPQTIYNACLVDANTPFFIDPDPAGTAPLNIFFEFDLDMTNLALQGGTATSGVVDVDTDVVVTVSAPGAVVGPFDGIATTEISVGGTASNTVQVIGNVQIPRSFGVEHTITFSIEHIVADPSFGTIPPFELVGTFTTNQVGADQFVTTTSFDQCI